MLLPLDKYPSLDVHGETRDTIYTVLHNFVLDNVKLKNSTFIVIHGRGAGILKKEIHFHLKNMKQVNRYYLHYWNQGVTIVELKID